MRRLITVLKHAIGPRRELGLLLNILGPMTNPPVLNISLSESTIRPCAAHGGSAWSFGGEAYYGGSLC